jgi:hypothetical protein
MTPWMIFLFWEYPSVLRLTKLNPGESIFVFVLASVAAGMILEDVGARIESHYDTISENREQHLQAWNSYLRTAFVAEPIGRRYAKSMVARLKFELGMGVGLAVSGIGTFCLLHFGLPLGRICVFVTLQLCASGYLIWESKATHTALHSVRHELSKIINVVK